MDREKTRETKTDLRAEGGAKSKETDRIKMKRIKK